MVQRGKITEQELLAAAPYVPAFRGAGGGYHDTPPEDFDEIPEQDELPNSRTNYRTDRTGADDVEDAIREDHRPGDPGDHRDEDERALAFKDIHPAAPFHALVIPKRPVVSIEAMVEDDAALLGHLVWVCKKVANDAGDSAYRVVSNVGAEAGQSVFHQHFHVLAGRPLSWPPG